MSLERWNRWLDSLPRTRFGSLAREAPAFRSMGIAGFYVAMGVTIGVGLGRGRSLALLLLLSGVCGLSFFAYALFRRWLTGREELVLLEHVWFALACCVGALKLLHVPVLGALDAVVCGLAFFLLFGRLGCVLVGCCHGQPSRFGVRYGESHVADGFPVHLVDVRLFPLQLVEAGGLGLIGVVSSLFALRGVEGSALTFFMVGYAVLRFGLEGLRGDARPHLLGISQSRWMAIAETIVAVFVGGAAADRPILATLGAGLGFFLVGVVWRAMFGRRAQVLRERHLDELRTQASLALDGTLRNAVSSQLVSVAASERGRVISLSWLQGPRDSALLCELAARAFPELTIMGARWTESGALVFERTTEAEAPRADAADWRALYGHVVRERQQSDEATAPSDPEAVPELPRVAPPASAREAYFGAGGAKGAASRQGRLG